MEPADTIIRSLGGSTAVSRLLGVHRTSVAKWKLPRSSGGTDGRVPQGHIPALLAAARQMGRSLDVSAFFPGDVATPAALPNSFDLDALRAWIAARGPDECLGEAAADLGVPATTLAVILDGSIEPEDDIRAKIESRMVPEVDRSDLVRADAA